MVFLKSTRNTWKYCKSNGQGGQKGKMVSLCQNGIRYFRGWELGKNWSWFFFFLWLCANSWGTKWMEAVSAVGHQIPLEWRMVGSCRACLQCVREKVRCQRAVRLSGVCFKPPAAQAELSGMHMQSILKGQGTLIAPKCAMLQTSQKKWNGEKVYTEVRQSWEQWEGGCWKLY